jgi:hypothetical protein
MIHIITAHSTKPGKEDEYENFLKQRKLRYVRCLPGISSYRVFRTERRFDPSMQASPEIRYTVIAIIEFQGNEKALEKLYTSPEWVEFMEEYMHLLEDDPALYISHEIPELLN